MCQSYRGLMLGCLIFALSYMFMGLTQVIVGVVFLLYIPVFRLASNIWTGGLNIFLGGIFAILISVGEVTQKKHRGCLFISITVVMINLANLLILEIWEWRAFLPPERIQGFMEEDATNLLLGAYLSSTVSTAVALVTGFVACEYIYCLLIAAAAGNVDQNKSQSKRKGFTRRHRRTSWYEPISFSWVYESSDHFNPPQVVARSNSLALVNSESQVIHIDSDLKGESVILNSAQSKSRKHVLNHGRKSGPCSALQHVRNSAGPSGRRAHSSKSSSGYSSPDLYSSQKLIQANNKKKGPYNHYENADFLRYSQLQLLRNYPYLSKHEHRHCRKGVSSLVQLPTQHKDLYRNSLMHSELSPIRQLTLPSHCRKRTILELYEKKKKLSQSSGWSPSKRFKLSTNFDTEMIVVNRSKTSSEIRNENQFHSSMDENHASFLLTGILEHGDLSKQNVRYARKLAYRLNYHQESLTGGSLEFSRKETSSARNVRCRDFPLQHMFATESALDTLPIRHSDSDFTSNVEVTTMEQNSPEHENIFSMFNICDYDNSMPYTSASSPNIESAGTRLLEDERTISSPIHQENILSQEPLFDDEIDDLKVTLSFESLLSGCECNTCYINDCEVRNEDETCLENNATATNEKDIIHEEKNNTSLECTANKMSSNTKIISDFVCLPDSSGNDSSCHIDSCPTLETNDSTSRQEGNLENPCSELASEVVDVNIVTDSKCKKHRCNSLSSICKKHLMVTEGISLQLLDRRINLPISDDDKLHLKMTSSDPSLLWKSADYPCLKSLSLINADSLVHLSNLELMARQIHLCSLPKVVALGKLGRNSETQDESWKIRMSGHPSL